MGNCKACPFESTEEMREVFDYHKDGHLVWRKPHRNNSYLRGKRAGCAPNKGDRYIRLRVNGQRYSVHRLVFFYFTGEWPEVIDHINRDTKNNRIENLRSVTHSENKYNSKQSDELYFKKTEVLARCWQNGFRTAKDAKIVNSAINKSHYCYDKEYARIFNMFPLKRQRLPAEALAREKCVRLLKECKERGFRTKKDYQSMSTLLRCSRPNYDPVFKKDFEGIPLKKPAGAEKAQEKNSAILRECLNKGYRTADDYKKMEWFLKPSRAGFDPGLKKVFMEIPYVGTESDTPLPKK